MKKVTSLLLLMFFMASTLSYAQLNMFSNVKQKVKTENQVQPDKMLKANEGKKLKMSLMEDPNQGTREENPKRIQVITDSEGDIVFNLDIEALTGDSQNLGCEFDGTYLWVTGANSGTDPNKLYKIDPFTNTLIATYDQPASATAWGIRDLCWVETDGLLYGGANSFYSFDPATETWTELFASTMGVIRALAYDGTHFWTKSFSGSLYEFDVDGNVINTYNPTVATSCYGAAYDPQKGFLYLFSQDDAVFYQFDLAGNYTGVSYDVSAAHAGGIAGGAFYDSGNLVAGKAILGFLLQGTPDIVAAMELYPSEPHANDVGVKAITEPNTGMGLTAAEPVTITIKNYGTTAQSDIPYEVTWSDGPTDVTVNGTYTGTLNPDESVDVTLTETADLSAYGDYEFTACTQLAGDEYTDNDCKEKTVTNSVPSYCDASTSTQDEFIENVLCGTIDNTSGWQGGVADYTDISTTIVQGTSEPIVVTNGNAWSSDKVTVWVDWNNDYEFGVGTDEEFVLLNVGGTGETFTGDIMVPPGTTAGDHRMRVRMTYSSDPVPCGSSSYGEVEDYTIVVSEDVSCDLECPPGAIAEGEECAGEDYVDNYNGGCNSDPEVYQPINLDDTICGTASTFVTHDSTGAAFDARDTDWYEFTTTETLRVYWIVQAEFPAFIAIMTADECFNWEYFDAKAVDKCTKDTLEAILPAGTYHAFIAPSVFTGYECDTIGNDYIATLTYETPVFGMLRGTVKDMTTNIGIAGVEVKSGMFSAVTAGGPFNTGQYVINLPTGTYDVSFKHPDYYPLFVPDVEVVEGFPTFLDTLLMPIPPGGNCTHAIELPVNGGAAGDTLLPGQHIWYKFTLTEDYIGMNVSACGSTFDTKLAVWQDCDDFAGWPPGQLNGVYAYNDDNCGLQSHIDNGTTQTTGITFPDTVPAGTYYVAIWGYSATSTGDYMLEIYGIPISQLTWLDGTVNDPVTKAPVEDVTITAGPFSTQTGEDGTYAMALEAGTYDVMAEKDGYIPQTAEDVVIAPSTTATVDFNLEFAPPVLTEAEASYFDISLAWEPNLLFLPAKDNDMTGADNEKLHGPTYTVPPSDGKALGDDCTNPIIIDALPYVVVDSTCGHGNNYDATCLGSYDGGEDVVFQLTLTEAKTIKMTLETTTTWTGMLITNECPIGTNCIDYVTGSGSNKTLSVELDAGTYYIMIDTWPSPYCIPEFTLTVEEIFNPYFEVYRTGGTKELLATTRETTYVDSAVDQGNEYCYEIVQVATPTMNLGPSNEMCAVVPLQPEISVAPMELNQILDINSTASQILTVTNSGPGPLNWNASIEFGKDDSKATVVLEDNIDAYTAGNHLAEEAIAQGVDFWTTWSNAPGGAEDPIVSTAQAASAPNSFAVEGTNDCVLLFGDKTEGKYNFEFKMYIPSGRLGYFNLLHLFDGASSEWGLQVSFFDNDTAVVDAGGFGAANFAYNNDVWMNINIFVDLDNDWCTLYVDNALIIGYQWSLGTGTTPGLVQLGAADFFAWDNSGAGTPLFYIDDVKLSEVDPWLTIAPTSGTILPDKGSAIITCDFNSNDLSYGFYNATINFTSNDPVTPVVSIPVQMLVGGVLQGTVTDQMSKGPVEGVTITAEELRASFTAVTQADGSYVMALPGGNFKVKAEKPGYVPDSVMSVPITGGQTTTQDFQLQFANPVLVKAEPSFFDVALEWEPNPLFVPVGDNSDMGFTTDNYTEIPAKAPPTGVYINPEGTRQGGDSIENAFVIPPVLPFSDTGTTEGYTNNYDEVCPYSGSTAPDVVYSFTPTEDLIATISLCNSGYDTKLYLYENEYTPGNAYACNDDGCPGYRSLIEDLFLGAGNTYYIVVDGYGSSAGEYVLDITGEVYVTCTTCPAEGIPEPEPCGEDLNGGCNMEDPAFTPIACGDVYCGTAWSDGSTRDTDWYELILDEVTEVTWSITAEFNSLGFIIDGTGGCEDVKIIANAIADACDTLTVSAIVPPGTYWLWAGPQSGTVVPCGSIGNYVAWLDCEPAFMPYVEVYRDDTDDLIATVYYGNTYLDADVEQGNEYCYYIYQIATPEITLGPSNTLCATVPYQPVISVTPEELNEMLDPGETSTQVFNINNSGLGDLDFDISISYLNDKSDQVNTKNFPKASAPDASISGEHSTYDPTDPYMECMEGSIFGLEPDMGNGAATTEEGPGYVCYQNIAASGTYQTVGFWGINLIYSGGWIGCDTEDPMGFEIAFWEDNAGEPGTLIYTEDVSISRFETGELLFGAYPLYYYQVDLSSTVTMDNGWVSIQGLTATPDCWFLWKGAPVGQADTYLQWNGTEFTAGGYPLAICLGGEVSSGWLSVDPASGTVPPDADGSMDINANFDATGLEPGVYNANILVNSNDPETPQVVVPVELIVGGMTQEINLPAGWSAWSSYLEPAGDTKDHMSMETVMEPVLEWMVITQYFNQLFYPEFGINTMDNFSNAHGYVSKMTEASVLPITGFMAGDSIPLYAGWNLLPVISTCNVDVTLLGSVTGFEIAWEVAGGGLYYPAYGINTIGDMVPGAAYYVKMNADGFFVFPPCPFDATTSANKPLRIENNTPWNTPSYTGVSHAVIFDQMASADLLPGDIIGAFTADGKCAGMAEVTGDATGLQVFADDITTLEKDGYVEGEALSFKVYRPETGDEFILSVTYDTQSPNFDGLFAVNGLSVVSDLTMTSTGINTQALNGLSIYPNPSDGIFNVSITNLDQDIDYVIVNAKGQTVLKARLLETQQIDLSAEPKGVYFIKFMNDNILRIEKVVIK